MKYLKQSPQKYLLDGNKLMYYPNEIREFMQGKRIYPISVDIGIHKGCQIRCVYCYGVYQKVSNDYIPTHRLLGIAKDAGKCGIKGVAIVGDGEPTLNQGLYPFVKALTDNGVASAVATNGLLLDSRKIDILTKNCSWLRFNVSAIGDKYPMIHRGTTIDDFKRLEGLIKYAVKHKGKCTIGIQMVLIPDCFDQIIPYGEWAVSLGIDYAQIKQFSDAGEGMPIHFDMKEYDKAEGLLRQAERLSTAQTQVMVKWKAMKDSKNITMDKKWDFDRCIDLPFLFQVSGNGKCYPCGYLFNEDKYCYGDLMTQGLKEILDSRQYWDTIEMIRKTKLENLCTGQCRHSSSLQFLDRFIKVYNGDVEETLIKLCGDRKQYELLRDNPPAHKEFI